MSLLARSRGSGRQGQTEGMGALLATYFPSSTYRQGNSSQEDDDIYMEGSVFCPLDFRERGDLAQRPAQCLA